MSEKICFVIMPITDMEGYPTGHFKRVYEHIIKPACIKAGFTAMRADDVQKTNIIIVDILQKIISVEMCVCDLSGRNPNVLYELGIRQSFGLPVTLIKDTKTTRIFDIQGIRDIEYDENLRIDIVEEKINELASTISNTYNSKEIHSLIQILNIKPADIPNEIKVSQEASLILENIKSLNTKVLEIEDKIEQYKYIPNETIKQGMITYVDPNGMVHSRRILTDLMPGSEAKKSGKQNKKP